ncbi:MAG TPA: hypothetical protein VFI29_19330, partial [Hanamia sp.]|nr:hypothetical protein [Hanamia sp.]
LRKDDASQGSNLNNEVALAPVVVAGKSKSSGGFWSSVGSALYEGLDYIPFAGSIKQIGEGIYHGDWKEAGIGVVMLGVDALTAGEGGEIIRVGEVAAEDALKVGAEDEVKEMAEKNFAEATEETELHHSDPKFLEGEADQQTTEMSKSEHRELHKDLNEHLDNYKNTKGDTYKNGKVKTMRPGPGNSGKRISQNFSRGERIQAMKDFYKGSGAKYTKAASDFFKQHP